MFTTQATLERRAAKEARLQAIENRLEATEVMEEKLITLESRLNSLEQKEMPQQDITPFTRTLADLSGNISTYVTNNQTTTQIISALQEKYNELQKTVLIMQEEIVELRKQQSKPVKQGNMFPLPQKKTTE